jgi:hypothetical protein
MPPTRPRRIVRRAVMVLAGVVLLPVTYVASAVSLSFADAAGWLPDSFWEIATPVYEPLAWAVCSDFPGTDTIEWAVYVAGEAGSRVAGE